MVKRLLAWDTSSKVGSLAALEWEPVPVHPGQSGRTGSRSHRSKAYEHVRLVAEWSLNVESTRHSERLLWAVHQLLEAARWKVGDIDVFGVGLGPGSFTGLRIGITTARTLAHTLGKPLVGFSSLACLVRPAADFLAAESRKTVLIAATDAAKGELFSLVGTPKALRDCVFPAEGERPGLWKKGAQEDVLAPEELVARVKKKLGREDSDSDESPFWCAVGEGTQRYPEIWAELPKERRLELPVPFSSVIQARYVGLLAWEAFEAGLARAPLDVHPRYLRASHAEIKLASGLLREAPHVPPVPRA